MKTVEGMMVETISNNILSWKIKCNDIKKTRDMKQLHQLFTNMPISARTSDLDYNNLYVSKMF